MSHIKQVQKGKGGWREKFASFFHKNGSYVVCDKPTVSAETKSVWKKMEPLAERLLDDEGTSVDTKDEYTENLSESDVDALPTQLECCYETYASETVDIVSPPLNATNRGIAGARKKDTYFDNGLPNKPLQVRDQLLTDLSEPLLNGMNAEQDKKGKNPSEIVSDQFSSNVTIHCLKDKSSMQ